MISYYDTRCESRNPKTNKQCVLVKGHAPGCHRWWRVKSQEYPTWQDGIAKEEWYE